jgi:hypothetical protein
MDIKTRKRNKEVRDIRLNDPIHEDEQVKRHKKVRKGEGRKDKR